MEAQVLIAKCRNSKKTFGIRVERRDEGWCLTWAFKIDEKMASREGFEKTKISGNFYMDEEFPGCPYCGAMDFIQCGCKKLTCYDEGIAECGWCGNKSKPVAGEQFEFTSGDY